MELLNFDKVTKQYTLKLESDEFHKICNLADCMAETYESTDAALLGMSREQIKLLFNNLQAVVKQNLKNRGLLSDEQTRNK